MGINYIDLMTTEFKDEEVINNIRENYESQYSKEAMDNLFHLLQFFKINMAVSFLVFVKWPCRQVDVFIVNKDKSVMNIDFAKSLAGCD